MSGRVFLCPDLSNPKNLAIPFCQNLITLIITIPNS